MPFLVGRVGRSHDTQPFDTLYPISPISDILRKGVGYLAQSLEHWISTPAIRVRIFFKLCIISQLRMFIFVRWGLVQDGSK